MIKYIIIVAIGIFILAKIHRKRIKELEDEIERLRRIIFKYENPNIVMKELDDLFNDINNILNGNVNDVNNLLNSNVFDEKENKDK